MRVLIACEYSGRVREAFRRRGHDAWSFDLLPAEDENRYHFEGDVLNIGAGINWGIWDLIIAHPPCTDLAVSGARHFPAKIADGSQQRAFDSRPATRYVPRCALDFWRWLVYKEMKEN